MPDDRLAQHRRAETTPRPAHRVEGEAADAYARADGVIGKEHVSESSSVVVSVGVLWLGFQTKAALRMKCRRALMENEQ